MISTTSYSDDITWLAKAMFYANAEENGNYHTIWDDIKTQDIWLIRAVHVAKLFNKFEDES